MQINTKTLLTIGGILAAGAITAIILKKRKSKKDFEMPPQDPYIDPNAAEAPKSRVTPPWSPAASAQALYDSMNGAFYTDEDLFFGTAESLSQDQRMKVQAYFNENLGEGDSLCEWIEGDFSFGDEDKALALFGHEACTFCWTAC